MVIGTEWGRVRSLRGTGGAAIKEVLPGQPAEIAGLKGLPQAGDQLLVRACPPARLPACLRAAHGCLWLAGCLRG
jgi:hypothetical protein